MGSIEDALDKLTPEILTEAAGKVMAKLGRTLTEAAKLLGEKVEGVEEIPAPAPGEEAAWLSEAYDRIGRMVVSGETGGVLDALVARAREVKSRAEAAGADAEDRGQVEVTAEDIKALIEKRAGQAADE